MTPPPATAVADSMPPPPPSAPAPGESKINREIMRVMDGASPGYFMLLGACVLSVTAAGATWFYQVYEGLGIGGYTMDLMK